MTLAAEAFERGLTVHEGGAAAVPWAPAPATISAGFPQGSRRPIALAAFAYWLVFYGTFALYVRGVVSPYVFATFGLFVFIRYFDMTHEEMHRRQRDHRAWDVLRRVFSVSGPLQLGYTQLAHNHRLHHGYEGTERDPDLWIMRASIPVAVLHCLTQPEQAVVRYVRANGVDRRLAFDLTLHFAAWIGLACVCTWQQFLLYNLVVRAGNGVSWFVFTHVLHRASVYRDFGAVAVPAWLRAAWIVLIGRNNLNAITFHFLHHAYGFVPGPRLPELSALLTAPAGRAQSGVYPRVRRG